MTDDKPTTVYILWNQDREVIYVGITSRHMSRLGQHAEDKDWWDEVAHATFKHYGSRAPALVAERKLIRQLDPPYNRTLSPRTKAYRREIDALERAEAKLDGLPEPFVKLARLAREEDA